MPRSQLARLSVPLMLILAAAGVGVLLFSAGSAYRLHARFYDAGQLVRGDLVTVGGHKVGSVGAITLAPDGLADVELNIGDDSITPVHSATIATIGQLSLTGVANRFVGLSLSGGGRNIPSGGTLPVAQTRGIVDLDVLLDSFTPRVRNSLRRLLRTGAYFVGQPTAGQINQGLPYLNPAFSQTAQLAGEVNADRFSLQRLVSTGATLSSGLAVHSTDLSGSVSATAATLRQIASARTSLADLLSRAPAVLNQSRGVLADVNYALLRLDPTVAALAPVAPRLATLLRLATPTAANAVPTVEGIQRLVGPAESALGALPRAVRRAVPAVRSLTLGLGGITPILAGLRPYAPDVVAGFFNGVGGSTGGSYDANGHYLKSLLTIQGGGGSLSGVLSLLGPLTGSLGPFNGARTGLVAPCPGGGNPPTADRSGPWTNPDVPAGTNLCNPAHDQRP